jgi:hypothetical protein
VLVTVTLVVPLPVNDAGEDVDASRRTDPVLCEPVMMQVAVTRAAEAPGDRVTDAGDSEHELTVPLTVGARAKADAVDTSWLVLLTSKLMSAVPTVTDCVGFTGTTDTAYIGFAVTDTFTEPLSVTVGYSIYVAVSEATPLPIVAPVYETVTVLDAPTPSDAEAGDAEQELTAPVHDELNEAVAATPPVFVAVNP